jgi:hypothetical protein
MVLPIVKNPRIKGYLSFKRGYSYLISGQLGRKIEEI